MFQNDCTLPLPGDLFCQAVHPKEPLLTVGLSTGHVECYRLPPSAPSPSSDSSDGKGHIETAWKTRRHKGSCRALAYSPQEGSHCFSAGTDAILKQFSPETGQVISKVAIRPSLATRGQPDQPSLLNAITRETLLLACDSGAIHLYDLRDARPAAKPAQVHMVHDDYVSSISPLPPVAPIETTTTWSNPNQFVSTGSTTLAVTDVRKGILVKSDDQEDDLLSSVFVPGLGPKKKPSNGILAVGAGSGVITIWDRGSWDDQQDRVYANRRRESVGALTLIPGTKKIVAAIGNGQMSIIDMSRRETEAMLSHDDEGAIAIDFDCTGRMISGGGQVVKVWEDIAVGTWENGQQGIRNDECGEDVYGDDDADGVRSKRKRNQPEDEYGHLPQEKKVRKKQKGKKGSKAKDKKDPQYKVLYGDHGTMYFPDL